MGRSAYPALNRDIVVLLQVRLNARISAPFMESLEVSASYLVLKTSNPKLQTHDVQRVSKSAIEVCTNSCIGSAEGETLDPGLVKVIDQWSELPHAARAGILAIMQASNAGCVVRMLDLHRLHRLVQVRQLASVFHTGARYTATAILSEIVLASWPALCTRF